LHALAEAGYLHLAGENYHWTQEAYPANTVSLRSVTSDNFVIIDITGQPTVIGEVDFPSALVFLHEKAIYIHGGQQHHVEHLDFKERKPTSNASTWITTPTPSATPKSSPRNRRDLPVVRALSFPRRCPRPFQVVGFKKIKFFSHENIGDGKLELPETKCTPPRTGSL